MENLNEETTNLFEEIKGAIKKLYEFRDLYHENHSVEEMNEKFPRVEKELGNVLLLFDKLEDENSEIENTEEFMYLKGYAYNVMNSHSIDAEELLTNCMLLNQSNADYWNELGDCYIKCLDFEEAEVCFKKGIYICKNKVSLRNLSSLARLQLTEFPEERIKNAETAIVLGKEAVLMDLKDGLSWFMLGNAYMSYYYRVKSRKTAQLCLNAYKQAEKDSKARGISELYYSKGLMLKNQQEFLETFASFERSLQIVPEWDMPITEIERLLNYLKNITNSLTMIRSMKSKKLKQFLQTFEEKHLAHYGKEKYKCLSGVCVNLKYVQFNDLIPGVNEEKVVLGKIISGRIRYFSQTTVEDDAPFTFCMVDKMKTCLIVTVNNLDSDLKKGDFVAIPEPNVIDYDFKYDSNEFKFRLIRLESHMTIVLNGKRAIPQELWCVSGRFG